jgi:hypothetical protein
VMLAEETDFRFDLLYARIVFRVDAADFTIKDEYTPLLRRASAGRLGVSPARDAEPARPVSGARRDLGGACVLRAGSAPRRLIVPGAARRATAPHTCEYPGHAQPR